MTTETLVFTSVARRLEAGTYLPHRAPTMRLPAPPVASPSPTALVVVQALLCAFACGLMGYAALVSP